jgi:hypothetical protein
MTDREWSDTIPKGAEFLTPGGLRCRSGVPDEADPPPPSPDHVFVEFWGAGGGWVRLSDLRTWKRRP